MPTLATVTVTFNPDIAMLEAQLRALPATCTKIIVDNASRSELISAIVALASRIGNTHIVRNDANLGLAAAVNIGVAEVAALPAPPQFVLLLDQDSEPQAGSVETLVQAFLDLERQGENVGCVGPLLRDPATGLTHGFHQCTRWRWKRVYPTANSTKPVSCANLNGSGTLLRVSLFQHVGGLDETFFIDHVDTEWAFRLIGQGYTLWGIPAAVFTHRMGNASLRFWCFGWKLWPARSPVRHYFLFRNAIMLMKRGYVPRVWKVWAVVKLVITACVFGICDPQRGKQLRQMLRGVREALAKPNRTAGKS